MLLRPLVLVCDYVLLCTLAICFIIALDAKHGLFVAKDNILVVGAIEQAVPLPIRLLVNEACPHDAERVVVQDLVLDVLRLEAEHGLQQKHRIVLLQGHKLSDDRDDDRFELLERDLQFALAERISTNVFEDALHERIGAGVLLQELIEAVHEVHLEEDPGLFELVDDAAEEACRHLNQVGLLREATLDVDDGHVPGNHFIVDQE